MSPSIDITGERYGKLIVLHEVESIKNSKGQNVRRWLCKCDCGNEVVVAQAYLRAGNTKSCGCLKKETAFKLYALDLTGEQYGRLKVLHEVESIQKSDGNRERMWLCQCSCGKQVVVRQSKLRSGDTQSCGCLRLDRIRETRMDLTGQTFGRWTVIEEAESIRHGKRQLPDRYWLCECICGTRKIVNQTSLTKGLSSSCGCLATELIIQRSKKYNHYELFEDYVKGYTDKGEAFIFDIDDYDKVKEHCWFSTHNGYIISGHKPTIHLHKLVLGASNSEIIDHINHNPADNRKTNLRIVTNTQNVWNTGLSKNNTSGCTGVQIITLAKGNKKYSAQIMVNYQHIYLGRFDSYEDAVNARKAAEARYYGEYSFDNSMKLAEQNKIII